MMNTHSQTTGFEISRQLTSHKIAYAQQCINQMNVQPGDRYIIEVHNKGGLYDHDVLGTWHVHYFRVLNDGEKVMEQDDVNGSYATVVAQFTGFLR